MSARPDIADSEIVSCIKTMYGISIATVSFLHIGGDLDTSVYRLETEDHTAYFCKLRRGDFDPTTVELPRFLWDQGVQALIPPLATLSGQLFTPLNEFTLTLANFVEGIEGYEVELTASQWANFGKTVKQLHTTTLPTKFNQHIRKEEFDSTWRERCLAILGRLETESFKDPIINEWVTFLYPKRGMVLDAVKRAEKLAAQLSSTPLEHVLCHSDLHPGNLLIDRRHSLFIVDWDYPMLAPKERDLMFIGGGQGYKPYVAKQEETLFYKGYGPSQIDPVALTYYRYERAITDIAVESSRILLETLSEGERAEAFDILQLYFLPGCTLEMAIRSDQMPKQL